MIRTYTGMITPCQNCVEYAWHYPRWSILRRDRLFQRRCWWAIILTQKIRHEIPFNASGWNNFFANLPQLNWHYKVEAFKALSRLGCYSTPTQYHSPHPNLERNLTAYRPFDLRILTDWQVWISSSHWFYQRIPHPDLFRNPFSLYYTIWIGNGHCT